MFEITPIAIKYISNGGSESGLDSGYGVWE